MVGLCSSPTWRLLAQSMPGVWYTFALHLCLLPWVLLPDLLGFALATSMLRGGWKWRCTPLRSASPAARTTWCPLIPAARQTGTIGSRFGWEPLCWLWAFYAAVIQDQPGPVVQGGLMRGGTLVTQLSHRRSTLSTESPRPMSMLGGRPTTCRKTRTSPSRFPLLRVPRQQEDIIWQRRGLPPEQPRPVIWCMQPRQSLSHLLHGDGGITLPQCEPQCGVGRSARGEASGCNLTSRSPRRRWSGKPRCWARHSNALVHYVHMASFRRNWRPNGGNHASDWDSD